MPALSQKIRAGLIELRTDIGPVYVRPSFSERIYLLWTFRHFRSLPQVVLNRRQRQLIDKLSRTAIATRNQRISRTSIIGAVENVRLIRDWKTRSCSDRQQGGRDEHNQRGLRRATSGGPRRDFDPIERCRVSPNRCRALSTEWQTSIHFSTQARFPKAKRKQTTDPGFGCT